jgi:predicted dehydrogenase
MEDHGQVIDQVKELTDGRFCEAVVEATGKQWPLDLSAEITAVRGRLIIAGYHQDGPRQVNMQLWNWRGLDVINAHERAPEVYKAGELAPKAAWMRTLQELLKHEIDGIVIATPSALHAAQTVNVLNRGAAVFCQKPLGRSLIEVRSVIEAAKAADRLLGVDLSYRFTAAMGHLRRLVQSGELGEIFAGKLVFHNAYGPQKPWFL